tara:strand:- start:10416 stop:11129 length:714 start_codon:yes stop_codon:yes gene_type:complete
MDKVSVGYELDIPYKDIFKTWAKPLAALLESNYMFNIMHFIHELYQTPVFPRPRQLEIFEVFQKVSFTSVKVVILIGEPVPGIKGNGIAMATRESEYIRPSMITEEVHKCIETTIYEGCRPGFDLTLEPWLAQGVLPLHAALTTQFAKKGEHVKLWKEFTRSVINTLNNSAPGIIFILLGKEAVKFKPLINEMNHYVLQYHTPLQAIKEKKDWNCPCFKVANDLLIANNGTDAAIVW